MSDDKQQNRSHSLIIEERKKLTISGVLDVLCFDERAIILETTLGELTIKGEGLHIEGFNSETGDLSAIGRVAVFAYTGDGKKGGSLFGRIFR